jgi:hypothetical protein
MSDISLIETKEIDEKVQIVLRQTDYTADQAKEKLETFNYNEYNVIKDYMGINIKKQETNNKHSSSINQQIYKQIRIKLDGSMREYREKKKPE